MNGIEKLIESKCTEARIDPLKGDVINDKRVTAAVLRD